MSRALSASNSDALEDKDILAALGNLAPAAIRQASVRSLSDVSMGSSNSILSGTTGSKPGLQPQPGETPQEETLQKRASLPKVALTQAKNRFTWLYNFVILRYSTWAELRILILLLVFINFISIALEAAYLYLAIYSLDLQQNALFNLPLAIVAMVFTVVNVIVSGHMLSYPSANVAFYNLAVIIINIAFYAAQLGEFIKNIHLADNLDKAAVPVVIVLIAIHVYSILIVYRYYEYVRYNYDDGRDSVSSVGSRPRASSARLSRTVPKKMDISSNNQHDDIGIGGVEELEMKSSGPREKAGPVDVRVPNPLVAGSANAIPDV